MKRASLAAAVALGALAAAWASAPAGSAAEEPAKGEGKRIVFLWSKEHHANEACSRLLVACLNSAANVRGVRAEMYEAWPKDLSVLDGAAAVVVYGGCEIKGRNQPHHVFAPEHRARWEKLMGKGAGLVCVHAPLYAMRETSAPLLLEWLGGYYDQEGYGSRHGAGKDVVISCVAPEHPIARGWRQITLPRNELYHNLRFAEDKKIVPVLTAPFQVKGGGPNANVVAWALERSDGGRSFGFGGGHFYENWMIDDLRTMTLNAILWAAKVEVPKEGVKTTVPEELKDPRKAAGP